MKYKLISGKEIDISPVPLVKRDVTLKINRALHLATKLDKIEDPFGDEFNEVETEYLKNATEAFEALDIPLDGIAEAEVTDILAFLRTGRRPKELQKMEAAAGESKPGKASQK